MFFEGYNATIVRYDAIDIAEDVEDLYELEATISEQVLEEVKPPTTEVVGF